MKLNKIQIIVLTIGFFLPIFIEFTLFDYFTNNPKFQSYHGIHSIREYGFISIMMFYLIFISTLLVLFLLDNKSKKFNRLQKIGLLFGGLLVNFHLVYLILYFLQYIYYRDINFPLFTLSDRLLKIVMVSLSTWLWVFIFKNKKTNPSKP